ncbi:hypothetical protein [Nocardia macrotermitis]|uniref:Uncharacterized protein n=1 Tax=Nocardia macrotermitis TaxID=2585198 RepID=A0A7K0CZY5_9NOCA|nr:hypothetical protein [Nocardia macrotermitis]MQY19046.1 hypothetical protein [Nocardia macrotermitis]
MAQSTPGTTTASVDTILDDAADGLKYFADFIDEYKRAFGGYYQSHELSFLYMRYDEQRGMDLAKLSAAATGLQTALKVADDEWNTQTGLSKQLPTIWQGEASTAAQDMFGKQLAQASDDKTKSRAVLDAIGSTVTGLQKAVQEKADYVKTLLGPSGAVVSGGKTKGEVDTIISGSKMETSTGLLPHSLVNRLVGIFPDQQPFGSVGSTFDFFTDTGTLLGITSGDHGYGKRLKDRCQEWLDKVFKPDFESKVNGFLAHCDTTNTTVEQAYTTLVQAAQQVTHKPFVRPVGTSAKATPSTPAPAPSTSASPSTSSSISSSTSTSGTTPTTTSPTNTNTKTSSLDASSLLSQASSALNGLGSLSGQLSSLGQTLSKDASSLSTTLQQGMQGFVSQIESFTKNVSGSADGKPKLEFDIAGKHVKFALGKNGEVDMSTSDSSGDSKSYTMKLDEHGLPVITSTDGSKDDKKSDGDHSGTAASHGSGSGTDSSGGSSTQHSAGTSDTNQQSGTGTQHSGTSQNTDSSTSGNQFPSTTPTPATSQTDKDKKTPTPASAPKPDAGTDNGTGAELAEAGPL